MKKAILLLVFCVWLLSSCSGYRNQMYDLRDYRNYVEYYNTATLETVLREVTVKTDKYGIRETKLVSNGHTVKLEIWDYVLLNKGREIWLYKGKEAPIVLPNRKPKNVVKSYYKSYSYDLNKETRMVIDVAYGGTVVRIYQGHNIIKRCNM